MKDEKVKKSAGSSKKATGPTKETTHSSNSIDVDAELQQIYDDALKAGLSPQQVNDCFKAEVFLPRKRSKWVVASAAMVPLAVLLYFVAFRADMIQDGVEYVDGYLQAKECLIESNPFTMEMLRPLANCSVMCKNLEEGVPRVDNITRDDFMKNYARTGRPLLVTGVASKWPALDVFSFDYFKALYNNHSDAIRINEEECQFFNYGCNVTTLRELIAMPDERGNLQEGFEPWYIGWSNCDDRVKRKLRKLYTPPEFVKLTEADAENLDWVFMGSTGPGAFIHVDNVEKPSWQAQIVGSKTWTLIPMPECESQCPGRMEITMKRGDILLVDTNNWYHSTFIHPGQISITIGSEYSRE